MILATLSKDLVAGVANTERNPRLPGQHLSPPNSPAGAPEHAGAAPGTGPLPRGALTGPFARPILVRSGGLAGRTPHEQNERQADRDADEG